jgi:hypothetical protein
MLVGRSAQNEGLIILKRHLKYKSYETILASSAGLIIKKLFDRCIFDNCPNTENFPFLPTPERNAANTNKS